MNACVLGNRWNIRCKVSLDLLLTTPELIESCSSTFLSIQKLPKLDFLDT